MFQTILTRMFRPKNLWRGIVLTFVIMCYWWFFWPIYELSIGTYAFMDLVDSGRQFYLFLLGAIITIPSIFIWRKIILG